MEKDMIEVPVPMICLTCAHIRYYVVSHMSIPEYFHCSHNNFNLDQNFCQKHYCPNWLSFDF